MPVDFPPELVTEISALVMQGFDRYSWGGPESGGVLFGTHENGSVTVKAYRPLLCEHEQGPAFTLSEKDEAALAALLKTGVEGLEPVGWFHSVYQDLYTTRDDVAVHQRHFPQSWQILMLLRRVKSEPVLTGLYVSDSENGLKRVGLLTPVSPAAPEIEPPVAEPAPDPKPEETVEPLPVLPPPQPKAMARLLSGIQARKGFMLLLAEPGPERHEFLSALLDKLAETDARVAYLHDPPAGVSCFFNDLAWQFGLACEPDSKPQALYALNDLLAEQASKGHPAVLIMDGAERLGADVLHEIQMFETLQNRHGKLLQVIFCGAPDFADRLDNPDLVDLKSQIAVRCTLTAAGFVKYN